MRLDIYPAGTLTTAGIPPRMTTTTEQRIEVYDKLLKICHDDAQTSVEAVIHWTNKEATLWRFACLVEHIRVAGQMQDFYASPSYTEYTLQGVELKPDHAAENAQLVSEVNAMVEKGQI